MQIRHDVGPGEVEILIATLELTSAKVVRGQTALLETGASGSVEDEDDAVAQGFAEIGGRMRPGDCI
jgi:hypothetical protein